MVYRVRSPSLPIQPDEYDRSQIDQFQNALRLYFNRLDDYLATLSSAGGGGGSQLYFPYGAFSSNQDQTATVNTATLMTLNTTDFSNGVSIASSKITVANAGIYNLQFSVQLENNDNAPQDVFIWLKQDGVDIPGSTGKIGLPARKGVGDPFHGIYGWNYFCSMAASDYIEIYWSTTDVDVTIQFYPASASPTKPATQSVVATMTFVSAL
jgi:hypothetical protein